MSCLLYVALFPWSSVYSFFSRRPPQPPTLFPYTTLFRSRRESGSSLWLGCQRRADRAPRAPGRGDGPQLPLQRRSEEHTSELQSRGHLVCRLLLEKKNHIDSDDRCAGSYHCYILYHHHIS